jgi:hypothetical protein
MANQTMALAISRTSRVSMRSQPFRRPILMPGADQPLAEVTDSHSVCLLRDRLQAEGVGGGTKA